MNTPIRVTLSEITDPDSIGPSWRDLETRSHHSYFISWGWIGTWLRMLPKNVRPILVKAVDGERNVGLAVLVRRQEVRHGIVRSRRIYLHETGDPELDELTLEFNGILAEAGREREVTGACLQYLARELSDWDEIALGAIDRVGDFEGHHLPGADLRSDQKRSDYFVDLAVLRKGDLAYLAAAQKKTQYMIRRALREYEAAGPVSVTVADNLPQAQEFLEGLKQLHQAHWTSIGKAGSFANAHFNRFHSELLATRFETGEIQILKGVAGDVTVGYLYNFTYRGQVYHYQSGMDYVAWSTPPSRPGFICHCFAIEYNRLAGNNAYHLMAGDERYKREIGTQSQDLNWAVLQRDRAQFRVERGLRRLVGSLRSETKVEADVVQ